MSLAFSLYAMTKIAATFIKSSRSRYLKVLNNLRLNMTLYTYKKF